MLHTELKSKIRKPWDEFCNGEISNPLQAIEQNHWKSKIFINSLFLNILLIIDGKGRPPAERQDSKSPQFTNIFGGCKWGFLF